MIHQLLDRHPVIWILLQTFIQKVPSLSRYKHIRWNTDLVLHYLNQLLLLSYFEWILAHQHLVHHYPQRPNIYFLVILSAFEDLWTDIERRPAEGGSQFVVLVDRPPEIT